MRKDEQIKLLADRLALAYSFIHDVEIDMAFEDGEPNRFSMAMHMVLSDLQSFEKMREEKRKTVFYELAMDDIRKWMRQELLRAKAAA